MSDTTAQDSRRAELADRVRSLKLPPTVQVQPGRGAWLRWLVMLIVLGGLGYGGMIAYQALGTRSAPEATEGGYVPPTKATIPAKPPVARAPATTPEPPAAKAPAKTATANGTRNVAIAAGGYIIPAQRVQVSPKVGGQVKELYIEEGQFVEKGSVLALLEDDEYQFDFQRTKALADLAKARYEELKNGNRPEEIQQAEAALREAEEQLAQAQDDLARLRKSGQAASEDEITKAEFRVSIARQRVEQQKSQYQLWASGPRRERIEAAYHELQQAMAQHAIAAWRLANTKVTAPISGIILEKKTEVGNTVRPEAFSNGISASVCDMADLRNLEVDVDISERDIKRIHPDQECRVRAEAYPDLVYPGRVIRIMPVASRSKASVPVRVKIEVPENDRNLRPEMRARVEFLESDTKRAAATR
jgi:HlyD family secretion protein